MNLPEYTQQIERIKEQMSQDINNAVTDQLSEYEKIRAKINELHSEGVMLVGRIWFHEQEKDIARNLLTRIEFELRHLETMLNATIPKRLGLDPHEEEKNRTEEKLNEAKKGTYD